MDFYDYNIVSIGHTSLDSDWIIRDAHWNDPKYNISRCERIGIEKTLEMNEICENDRKIHNKDYYMNSLNPKMEKTDLHFFFWHVFSFSPLNTFPIDTEFHVRKYECVKKDADLLTISKESHKTSNFPDKLYYASCGASIDELQLVLQFTIPCPVKPCDLPKEYLSEITELMDSKSHWICKTVKWNKLYETDSCVPFSGKVARAYYLSEFISRCENLINSKSREKQPEENPHVSMRKKQK